jgi:hypothetical protein
MGSAFNGHSTMPEPRVCETFDTLLEFNRYRTRPAERVFEKSHAGAIRFSIRRIEARSIIVSEVCTRYS